MHHGDLGDAGGRQVRLIVEYAAKVVPVRKHLVLGRQESAATLDQVDAGQVVLGGDFLGPQVLFDGQRVIGPALDGRIVGDDDTGPAGHRTDPGDDSRGRYFASVQAVRGQRRQFEKRSCRIQQPVDPLPHQQAPALAVLGDRLGRPSDRYLRQLGVQIRDKCGHRRLIGRKLGASRIHGSR